MMDIKGVRGDGRGAEVKRSGDSGGGKETGAAEIPRGLGPEGAVIIVVVSPWVGNAGAERHAQKTEQGRRAKLPWERTGGGAGNQGMEL